MTSSVSYLANTVDQIYSVKAIEYISSDATKTAIYKVAGILGVSAGAIAGAIAEEATSYYADQTKQDLLDQYATSNADPEIAAGVFVAAGLVGLSTYVGYELSFTQRTQAEWVADYAVANGDVNPGDLAKIEHPVLVDAGVANFKIFTAIRLVNKYAAIYPTLQLDRYLNDYPALVRDLINKDNTLTVTLYALYLKECSAAQNRVFFGIAIGAR